MSKQLYWIGPGVFGTVKNMLQKGDPIPKDFPKENYDRFKNKIGEKIEAGVIENIAESKDEIKKLKVRIKELEKENLELLEQLESTSEDEGGE